jgi:hypothetical protein
MRFRKKTIGVLLFLLLVITPPFFSVFFEMLSISIPAYLFSILVVVFLLFFNNGDRLVYTVKSDKTLFSLFFIWLSIGVFYGDSTIEARSKLFSLFYLIIAPILLIEVYFNQRKNESDFIDILERYSYSYAVVFVLFLLIPFIFFKQYSEGRLVLPGLDNPIWITRFVGMLVIMLVYCKPLFLKDKKIYYTILLIAFLLMFISGSRTPMLSVLFCILLISNSIYSFKKNIGLILLLLCISLLGFFYLSSNYLFDTNFYSLYERIDIFKNLFDMNFDYIKGIGTGSFGMFFYGEDKLFYPHNSFLEVFVENGIIGFVLYCGLIFAFIRKFKLNIISLLVLYTFINGLTSGDIPGNNVFYILLYLSFYISKSTLSNHYNIVKNEK